MYGIKLTIRPTGGLTFRRMPGSILHISTYPFLPPTAMSGWLRRLFFAAIGNYPETAVKDPPYYTMPADYHILGAYPVPDPRTSYQIHTTRRQGIRDFKHNAFSRIVREMNKDEVYQLHTWEYLMVDRLEGVVLHEDDRALEIFEHIRNHGCKIGKEGYAFVENISPVREFERVKKHIYPSTPLPAKALIGQPGTLFSVYRFQFPEAKQNTAWHFSTDPFEPSSSEIRGYVPLRIGWPAAPMTLEVWTDGESDLPTAFVEELYG